MLSCNRVALTYLAQEQPWGSLHNQRYSSQATGCSPRHPAMGNPHGYLAQVWGPRRCKPNEATYRAVTRICREAGLVAEALRAYSGMRAVGLKPSNAEWRELIGAAAEAALAEADGGGLTQQVPCAAWLGHNALFCGCIHCVAKHGAWDGDSGGTQHKLCRPQRSLM